MKRFFPVFMVPLTALVLSAGMTAQGGAPFNADDRDENESRSFEVVEATIPQLQEALEDHEVTSKTLVRIYLRAR